MFLMFIFLVVSKGKPSFKSNLICVPNIDFVPTPVLSSLSSPFSIIELRVLRYVQSALEDSLIILSIPKNSISFFLKRKDISFV